MISVFISLMASYIAQRYSEAQAMLMAGGQVEAFRKATDNQLIPLSVALSENYPKYNVDQWFALLKFARDHDWIKLPDSSAEPGITTTVAKSDTSTGMVYVLIGIGLLVFLKRGK